METILTYIPIIQFVVIAGVIAWLVRNIKAVKVKVEAQKETINAQSQIFKDTAGLITSMRTVVESSDERDMLERLKAHKEFVDHEIEAAMAKERQKARRFMRECKAQGQEDANFIFKEFKTVLSDALGIAGLIGFIPKPRREAAINSLAFSEKRQNAIRVLLHRIAETVPDLSVHPGVFALFHNAEKKKQ
jgi:hypothetical protein